MSEEFKPPEKSNLSLMLQKLVNAALNIIKKPTTDPENTEPSFIRKLSPKEADQIIGGPTRGFIDPATIEAELRAKVEAQNRAKNTLF